MGLQGAGTRFYFKYKNDTEKVKRLWGTLVTFVLCSSVVVFSLAVLLHKWLIDPIVGNIAFYPFILLGLLNVLVTPLYIFFQTYLQTLQIGYHYGINTFLNFLINVGLIILFVVGFEMGVVGVLVANLLTSIIFFVYVAISFMPKIKMGIDKPLINESLKYSLPLVPHLLANWSTGMIDRLLINGLRDESETGLYSVASQFGSVVNTVVTAVNGAFSPWFFEKYEDGDIISIKRMATFVTFFYCAIALVISLFAPEVLRIMVSEEFRVVWTIIPLLSFAYVFQGLYCIFINVLFIRKTKLVFLVSVSALVTNVVLNVLLIPKYGYVGGAISCVLAFFIKSLVAYIIATKSETTIRFNAFKLYAITFMAMTVVLLSPLLYNMSLLLSLSIKIAVCLIIVAFVYFRYKEFVFAMIKSRRATKSNAEQ